jgi:hypothetical protein
MNTAYRHHDRNYARYLSAAPLFIPFEKLLVGMQKQRENQKGEQPGFCFASLSRAENKRREALWFPRLFANLLTFQARCCTKEIICKWLHLKSSCVRSLNNSSERLWL